MTKEEYLKKIEPLEKKVDELKSQISQCRAEIADIRKQFIEELDLKVGDKVIYTATKKDWNTKEEKVVSREKMFILKFEWLFDSLKITLSRPKKDGTMSLQSAGIWGVKLENLEKVKDA